jgi:hypothetical protein
MNFVGVRGGGKSVVGVAVPESGYAGEGEVEASVMEESMPESIAIPSVPVDIIRQLYIWSYAAPLPIAAQRDAPPKGDTYECYKIERERGRKELLTATKHRESHGLGTMELVLAIRDVQGRHVTECGARKQVSILVFFW